MLAYRQLYNGVPQIFQALIIAFMPAVPRNGGMNKGLAEQTLIFENISYFFLKRA